MSHMTYFFSLRDVITITKILLNICSTERKKKHTVTTCTFGTAFLTNQIQLPLGLTVVSILLFPSS